MSLSRAAVAAVLTAAIGFAKNSTLATATKTLTEGWRFPPVNLVDADSAKAQLGRKAHAAKCVSCHGLNAAGQKGVTPTPVRAIFEIGYYGDESFQRAAAHG